MNLPDLSSFHPRSDLTAEFLIRAYCCGLFPMARSRNDQAVAWYSPPCRGIIPLDHARCPRSVRKLLREKRFEIRHDSRFRRVMELCAEPRRDDPQTWINQTILDLYCRLHDIGLAHSVEAWAENGRLVGGLYGVTLGGAFFGESMFHRPQLGGTNASKVCLVHLIEHLRRQHFSLLDTQVHTPHLAQFGGIEIPRAQYMKMLHHALEQPVCW